MQEVFLTLHTLRYLEKTRSGNSNFLDVKREGVSRETQRA